MAKPTAKARERFQVELEQRGVPGVLAYMCAQRITHSDRDYKEYNAANMIGGFFVWSCSPEGGLFWDAVHQDAGALAA